MNQTSKHLLLFLLLSTQCVVCMSQTEITSDSLYQFLLDIGETEEQSYAIVHEYTKRPYSEPYGDIINQYIGGGALRKIDISNWEWYPVYIEINSKRTKYLFSRFVNDTTLDYSDYIYNSYILWNGPQNEWINEFTRYMYHRYNVISALPLINDYYYSNSGCKGICAEDGMLGYRAKVANTCSEEDEAAYHYYMMAAAVYNLRESMRHSNVLQRDINTYQSYWSKAYKEYINTLTRSAVDTKRSISLSEDEILSIIALLNNGIKENDFYCQMIMVYALLTGTIVEQDIERGITLCKQANIPICDTFINYFKRIKEKRYNPHI